MANIKVTPAFSSNHLLTKSLVFLLVMCILINLISIALGYSEVVFLSSVLSGEKVLSYTDIKADYDGQQFVSIALIAAYLVSGVVFLIWLYRARRNLLAVGSRGQRIFFTLGHRSVLRATSQPVLCIRCRYRSLETE